MNRTFNLSFQIDSILIFIFCDIRSLHGFSTILFSPLSEKAKEEITRHVHNSSQIQRNDDRKTEGQTLQRRKEGRRLIFLILNFFFKYIFAFIFQRYEHI